MDNSFWGNLKKGFLVYQKVKCTTQLYMSITQPTTTLLCLRKFAVQTFTSSMDALSSLWESTEGELKTIVFLIGSLVTVSLHNHYCPSQEE
jgi:hypothetical protein